MFSFSNSSVTSVQDGRPNSIITYSYLEIKPKVAVLQPLNEVVSSPVFIDRPLGLTVTHISMRVLEIPIDPTDKNLIMVII